MRYLLLLISIFLSTHVLSQETFIKVNEDSIDYNSFQEMYGKNIKAEGLQSAIDAYIEFTLLNQHGKKLQADTTTWFNRRFNQLGSETYKSFTTDSVLLTNLTKLAFDRAQTERSVSLYNLPVNNWYDSNEVKTKYQQLYKIYNDLCLNGSKLGLASSFDKEYNRKSSFISPFQLSKDIEDLIYETPLGQCSEVNRLDKGWAFVKVNESREARGDFFLSHIASASRDSIQMAYKALSEGMSFSQAVQKYSDDIASRDKNGRLPMMNTNIRPEIYNVIKYLNVNEYSIPTKFDNRWHIFQLNFIRKCTDYNKCAPTLKKQILNSDWINLFDEKLKNEALQLVPVTEDKSAIFTLKKLMGNDYFTKSDTLKVNYDMDVWTTPTSTLTLQELAQVFELQKKMYSGDTDFVSYFSDTLQEVKESFILHDYMNHLEEYNSDFATEIDNIKKLLRINYAIENDIYSKAVTDTVGLKAYLRSNPEDFTWPLRHNTVIYRTLNEQTQTSIKQMIEEGKSKEDINAVFNNQTVDRQSLLFIYSGKLLPSNQYYPKEFVPSIGVHTVEDGKYFYIIDVKEEIEPVLMTIQEAGPVLIDSYKNHLYLKTIKALKANSDVQVQFVQ